MGDPRRFRLPIHRSRLSSLCNSHREQHPVRELPRSHRPLQDFHRRGYRIRYRLLPTVQCRSTATNDSDSSSCSYIDRRRSHIPGSYPRRRSSRIRKAEKVAPAPQEFDPSLFFLTLQSKLSRLDGNGFVLPFFIWLLILCNPQITIRANQDGPSEKTNS